jgi:hypothetical protein
MSIQQAIIDAMVSLYKGRKTDNVINFPSPKHTKQFLGDTAMLNFLVNITIVNQYQIIVEVE